MISVQLKRRPGSVSLPKSVKQRIHASLDEMEAAREASNRQSRENVDADAAEYAGEGSLHMPFCR